MNCWRLYERYGEALGHQPGVKSVSFVRMVPLSGYEWDETYKVPGESTHNSHVNAVGPAYFQTMRIPLLEGRDYRWTDTTSTGLKIILSQAAAKLLLSWTRIRLGGTLCWKRDKRFTR